ncbi:DUF2240 family protein [Halosimplex rubrum]|uniref:DUF2240 family protein n=1 Tax=Halosimplex rubrum TaxID=869889 RepID=A0A7D5TM70_9EURY|nr:DUF2240 family protein [Halosimplex rubrum]QLH78092.1 DUF2240 family protein [Halosimplex rubrum]
MSLRRAVAVPFRAKGRDSLSESEFVVALSLDREWFSPEQAKRLVDVAATEGLLAREDDDLRPTFEPREVTVPDGFAPGDDVLRQRSNFERALDAVVQTGVEKQDAVAAVNRLQSELGVTVEAAAVVYARREGVELGDLADRAADELGGD